ncbi:cytochrome P450 78A3-like [Chenopodium quinoa]|uniref:Cytochrome P450 n=1 Tax=Chenopodium quinoa TaxID=63459 RepID=A0A803KZS9_CHEQI|nr:cytochrome P450 78A3-like [Chenopodium quinoa]
MSSQVDSLWLFALASKCNHLTIINIVTSILLLALIWLAMSLIYWAHQGGPAWGKYSWTHFSHWAKKPIPGPRGWPIFGSVGLKMGLAHHKIAAMAKHYNSKRVMAFSLGDTRMIVTCNADVAKEILNSPVFVDRPDQESAYGLMFNRSIGFAPYGSYWRTLRRISGTHMFSPKQIKAYEAQRSDIVSQMVQNIGDKNGSFKVREMLRWASLGNMMGSVFGERNMKTEELKEMVEEGYDLLGVFNLGDHLSWLSDFDFHNIRFRCSQLVPKVNRFVGRIIEEHRLDPAHVNRDFVDVLLSLQHPDKLSDSDMIAVLWEMIFRGTDSIAVLIEWILARLVIHPDIQSKIHDELDNIVGRSRAVTESDISSLVYLTAVIKEVLRLHPPGPLLSWSRLSIEDTLVDGCHVPAGTTATVNMWAIARDSDVWASPLEFQPNRFLVSGPNADFSVLGSDLRLAPFGSGRRSCPGKMLGLTTVSFWVASLVHEFEWVTSLDGEVDLSEELKISCEMANPLTVEVRPRRSTNTLLL